MYTQVAIKQQSLVIKSQVYSSGIYTHSVFYKEDQIPSSMTQAMILTVLNPSLSISQLINYFTHQKMKRGAVWNELPLYSFGSFSSLKH